MGGEEEGRESGKSLKCGCEGRDQVGAVTGGGKCVEGSVLLFYFRMKVA